MKKWILHMLLAMGCCSSCMGQSPVKVLEPKEFIAAAQADTSAVILDVRQPSEYADGHLKGAVNLDWLNNDAFDQGMAKLSKDRTYYVYCRSGRRSHAAAVKLYENGFKVFDLKGGYLHWTELGLPVEL